MGDNCEEWICLGVKKSRNIEDFLDPDNLLHTSK